MYLTLICKPTHQCNLKCQYCYDIESRKSSPGKWNDDTIDRIGHLLGQSHDEISFTWHGGECLILGAEWIANATQHMNNIARSINPNAHIHFGLQSNGLLLTPETTDLLFSCGVCPAISYDGEFAQYIRSPKKEDQELIKNNIKYLFTKQGGAGGAISVITNANVSKMIDIYEELKSYGALSLSFNNVFPSEICGYQEKNLDLFIKEWNKFFDYWLYDKDGVRERTCLSYLKRFFNNKDVVCERNICLNHFLCIDADGNIYPCDSSFKDFNNDEYLIDNIFNPNISSFFDIFDSEQYKKYKKGVAKKQIKCLTECDIYNFCKGGCPAKTLSSTGDYTNCELFNKKWQEAFIEHIFEKIKNLEAKDLILLNPYAYEVFAQNGYISLKNIQECYERALEVN